MNFFQRLASILFGWKYHKFQYFQNDGDEAPSVTWVQRLVYEDGKWQVNLGDSPIVYRVLTRASGYWISKELK